MAICAQQRTSAIYPKLALASTARHLNAAGDRARLRALGPGGGGDGPAAGRPLQLLLPPALRSEGVTKWATNRYATAASRHRAHSERAARARWCRRLRAW